MGSYSLLDKLSWKCECNRFLYPEEGPRCVFCESSTKWRRQVYYKLAFDNVFGRLPVKVMKTVFTFLATNAHEQYQRAITGHILLTPGSPLRAFRYITNGMKGNISEDEDILDRILSFAFEEYTDPSA